MGAKCIVITACGYHLGARALEKTCVVPGAPTIMCEHFKLTPFMIFVFSDTESVSQSRLKRKNNIDIAKYVKFNHFSFLEGKKKIIANNY